jgi:hypothetical protein
MAGCNVTSFTLFPNFAGTFRALPPDSALVHVTNSSAVSTSSCWYSGNAPDTLLEVLRSNLIRNTGYHGQGFP